MSYIPVDGALDFGDCEAVKNITVSVDEELYHRARVKAAEKRTSLSAMVREFLAGMVEEESEFERLRRRERELREKLRADGVRFRAGERLTREELHERHEIR
jgi:hypothetical protein